MTASSKLCLLPSLPDGFLDKPYVDINDPLSKLDLANRLTSLYSNLAHGTVSILHGRWGTGKSTFARKWLAGLREDGFGTIYFDAFSNDYIDDPFVAITSTLLRNLEAQKPAADVKIDVLKRNAVAVSKKLLMAGAKVGIKAASLGALSYSDLNLSEELTSATSDSAVELGEKFVRQIFDEQAKAEATFDSFRKGLEGALNILSAPDTKGYGRVVFVIDELDRCRPDFALRLIESIKHFFRTNGLHFVLVTNKDFLIKSVSAKYGLEENSEEYLDKFFDFSIFIEESSPYESRTLPAVYANQICSQLLGKGSQDARDLAAAVADISSAFNLTFRQIERIATNAALAYSAFGDHDFRPTHLVAHLCFLKSIHPGVFQLIKIRQFHYSHYEKILHLGKWKSDDAAERISRLFRFYSDPGANEESEEFSNFGGSLHRYDFDSRLDVLPHIANSVIDRFARM